MNTIKGEDVKVGDCIVLPADWPEPGKRRERFIVTDILEKDSGPYRKGELVGQVIDLDPGDPEDSGYRDGIVPTGMVFETWKPVGDECLFFEESMECPWKFPGQ